MLPEKHYYFQHCREYILKIGTPAPSSSIVSASKLSKILRISNNRLNLR